MTYLAITFSLSYQRCRKPAGIHPLCRAPSWISCWILTPTGPLRSGIIGSALFSGGTSPIHTKDIWSRPETFSLLLYQIRCSQCLNIYLLCCFMAYLANEGLAPQTGKSYLSAVRSMQIALGLPDPRDQSSLPVLKRVQAGIRRVRLSPSCIRLPITAPVLDQMWRALNHSVHPNKVGQFLCSNFWLLSHRGTATQDSKRI